MRTSPEEENPLLWSVPLKGGRLVQRMLVLESHGRWAIRLARLARPVRPLPRAARPPLALAVGRRIERGGWRGTSAPPVTMLSRSPREAGASGAHEGPLPGLRSIPGLRLLSVALAVLGSLALAAPAQACPVEPGVSVRGAFPDPLGQKADDVRKQIDDWIRRGRRAEEISGAVMDRVQTGVKEALRGTPGPSTFALGLRLTSLEDPRGRPGPFTKLSARGVRYLKKQLWGESSTPIELWMLTRVVAAAPDAKPRGGSFVPSRDERRVAIGLLLDAKVAALRTGLLTVARRKDDPLRAHCIGTLARWAEREGQDETVDSFLVELLGERFDPTTSPHPFNIMLERLRESDVPLAPGARERLAGRLAQMMLSNDWREVARAIRLSEGFPVDERVPMLLDALNVWHRRSESGREVTGLIRSQGDLVRALRDLSGRFHGPQPGPWIDWWILVRQGELPRPGTEEFEKDRKRRERLPRSTSSFFGVKPATDRVTFVIDFSGSMRTGFGTDGRTRYVEAVEQMMRFLQGSAPSTRFSIILFSNEPITTGDKLLPNDPRTLEKVRKELLAKSPEGGTHLRPAIERALFLDTEGVPDLEKLEADTIVVLCDGQTEEGSGWVERTLKRVLPHHPVVFHCIDLGGRGDGTLQRLSTESSGIYLRVGG